MYPLWAFSDGKITIVTRGSTQDIAHDRVTETWPRQGVTIFPVHFHELDYARRYDLNHAPGWLHRIPVYEARKNPPPAQQTTSEVIQLLKERLHGARHQVDSF